MRRKKSKFVAAKLWKLLRDNPGITAKQLREITGWSSNRMSCMLRNLKDKGYARNNGSFQVNTKWYAVGEKPPENRNGTHANSLAALQKGNLDWKPRLERAFVARGVDPQRIGKGPTKIHQPRPFGECALASCWTLPNSGTKRAA